MYVLGIDFGGGASKATLLDERGQVAATASCEYPTHYGADGAAEQDARDWYAAACRNIRRILCSVRAEEIACVCFDAATHVAVLLDERDEPLRRAVYWTDTRSSTEAAQLNAQYAEKLRRVCKHEADTIWTLPVLMYLRRTEPELYAKTARVTFAKDYVRGRFTGDRVTDYIEAQGSMLFDFDAHVWDEELLALAGLRAEQMPRIVSPLEKVGAVTAQAARDSGLAQGTAVICGATDTVMEVFAAGGAAAGAATVKLATAGRICVIAEQCFPDRNIVNYAHLKQGLYYPGSATKSCAASLRWFRDAFSGDYAAFDGAAQKIPVGAEGLIFHPYLTGELTPYADPALRGSFVGIGAQHTKAHFVRAVLEGVALSLLDCKRYLEGRGVPVGGQAVVIGGGAKSALWRSILADALGMTLFTAQHSDSSFGSAMCAGIAAGFFADFDGVLRACRKLTGVTQPVAENHARYQKIYAKYRKISAFLTELAHEK